MKKSITISAPGKLMLFGEHSVVYGYPCIVTAVDQRMKLTATVTDDQLLVINARDVKVDNYKRPINELGKTEIPKGAKFVEIAVKNFAEKYPLRIGISITTSSDFKSTFGFGSSSASTVCTIKALAELCSVTLSNRDIFDLAYKTVLDIQGKGSGFDVAAAIYGGTLYFVTGGETISPLVARDLPLVVGYSGIKADTVTLINKVAQLSQENPALVKNIYEDIAKIVESAKIVIEKVDWIKLGKLMNDNQSLLLSLGVSIDKLDAMIHSGCDAGAYGAKLSGAGGGDCMIALTEISNKKKVTDAIEKVGGEIIDVKTNAKGVRVEK